MNTNTETEKLTPIAEIEEERITVWDAVAFKLLDHPYLHHVLSCIVKGGFSDNMCKGVKEGAPVSVVRIFADPNSDKVAAGAGEPYFILEIKDGVNLKEFLRKVYLLDVKFMVGRSPS